MCGFPWIRVFTQRIVLSFNIPGLQCKNQTPFQPAPHCRWHIFLSTARCHVMEKHDIGFNNNINGKYWSQLSVCCARGFNFKLQPTDISDPFPIPTFVLSVDTQVGCLSLCTDCPTYDAECSIVNLPDSKRFSRSGLDVVQQDVFRPDGWALFTSSNLQALMEFNPRFKDLIKCFIRERLTMFSILSYRTKNSPPQKWCPRDRGACQPCRRHCCIRGNVNIFWGTGCWLNVHLHINGVVYI